MRVHFWGVRGSVPWATPEAIKHGCNTPCIELLDEESDEMLVLDAGSGIVGLGAALDATPRHMPVLLTHFHWDHLQGLPFFAPLYRPKWSCAIWAPSLGCLECQDVASIETMFRSPFFPVPYEALPAQPKLRWIDQGDTMIGPFRVRSLNLNHPGGAFAYRIVGTDGDLVYATDHEFGNPEYDEPLAAFVKGASALILDAHFTPDEMPAHRGWGHSSWEQAAQFAASSGVEQLWLFHHKPGRSDVDLTEIEAAARRIFPRTDAAGEGDIVMV